MRTKIESVTITGKMPKTCYQCPMLLVDIEMAGAWGIDFCVFAPDLDVDYEKLRDERKRPDFCPLKSKWTPYLPYPENMPSNKDIGKKFLVTRGMGGPDEKIVDYIKWFSADDWRYANVYAFCCPPEPYESEDQWK